MSDIKRPEGGEQRHRVELELTPSAFERLKEIRELAGAKTNGELVRNALRVYEWFLNQRSSRRRILTVGEDDSVKEVELLL